MYISVDLAHHKIYRAEVGKGGVAEKCLRGMLLNLKQKNLQNRLLIDRCFISLIFTVLNMRSTVAQLVDC